jgi:hypothetical protein
MPQSFRWPWPHNVLANHEAPPRVVLLNDRPDGALGSLRADTKR